ncbi:hypothetical protein E2320_013647 [Naja naja]|nr:hypothetical protein E2320_013647 [Naja naja]
MGKAPVMIWAQAALWPLLKGLRLGWHLPLRPQVSSSQRLKAKPFPFCQEGFLDQHKAVCARMDGRLRQRALGAAWRSAEQVASHENQLDL